MRGVEQRKHASISSNSDTCGPGWVGPRSPPPPVQEKQGGRAETRESGGERTKPDED